MDAAADSLATTMIRGRFFICFFFFTALPSYLLKSMCEIHRDISFPFPGWNNVKKKNHVEYADRQPVWQSRLSESNTITHVTCNFRQPPSLRRENYSFHHLKSSSRSHPYLVLHPAMICGSSCQANKFGYGGRVLLAAVNGASGGESRGLYYTVWMGGWIHGEVVGVSCFPSGIKTITCKHKSVKHGVNLRVTT